MFSETIIGHQDRLADLAKALHSGRLNHAYLFVGPAGVGKTAVAHELAQAMLCQEQTLPACGKCRSCMLFAGGNHPDFRQIGLDGTNIKMELIRELQRDAGFHPLVASRKVFLLNPMEMMTEVAANGLLKTLEEPPPSVHFIGIAEDESALLTTIRSRMSTILLAPVPAETIADALLHRGIPAERAHTIAKLSRGLPGVALHMLEEEDSERFDWGEVLQNRNLTLLLRKLGEAEKLSRADVEIWLEEITTHYRNLLHQTTIGESSRRILESIEAVRTAKDRLAANVNARLLLEALFLKLCAE
ncbi:MAG TPA: AAA family ATPase [Bacillota bacterium]|nr:AAA family ATPase [Bacillota bacterium]